MDELWQSIKDFFYAAGSLIGDFFHAAVKVIHENGDDILINAATAAVKAAEAEGGSGKQKRDKALEAIADVLIKQGIEPIENAMRLALETALAKQKQVQHVG